jgi:hypothetical protein
MDWIIKYFNITDDIDLFLLVIQALLCCVLLMFIFALFPKIKNILISIFSFSRPKIINWVVQVSDTEKGKKIDLVWEVKSATNVEIVPILTKPKLNKLVIFFDNIIASICLPFILKKNSAIKQRFLLKKNRFKSSMLLSQKLSIPEGRHSFYLSNDNVEINLKVKGFWGNTESKVLVNSVQTNTKKNNASNELVRDYTKSFEEMMYFDFLNNLKLFQLKTSSEIIQESSSSKFKSLYHLTKNKEFNDLRLKMQNSNKQDYYILKFNRINFQTNFNFVDYRNKFLKFRSNEMNN